MKNIILLKNYLSENTYSYEIINETINNNIIEYTIIEHSPLGKKSGAYKLYIKDNKIYNENNERVL